MRDWPGRAGHRIIYCNDLLFETEVMKSDGHEGGYGKIRNQTPFFSCILLPAERAMAPETAASAVFVKS